MIDVWSQCKKDHILCMFCPVDNLPPFVSSASGDQTAHIWRYVVQLPTPQPVADTSVSMFSYTDSSLLVCFCSRTVDTCKFSNKLIVSGMVGYGLTDLHLKCVGRCELWI